MKTRKSVRILCLQGILLLILSNVQVMNGQYDKSFLEPPRIIENPASTVEYRPENRTASGIPSMAVSRSGRLWATWYTGITPEKKVEYCPANYVVLATSCDNGENWQEVLAIDPDGPGPVRAADPQVWVDPEGKLWVFWMQEIKKDREITTLDGQCYGVWAITTRDSDSGNPRWTAPRRYTNGVMISKPLVLTSGEWVFPVSTWSFSDNSAKMFVSTDKGNTWELRGAVHVPKEVRNADEHHIIERKDGSLWMLVRTKYGIGESTSVDRGISWSPLKPSGIEHATARFFIRRLNSGNLLLVKHGPIDMRTSRSHMMAFISTDDGRSWSDGLLLDQRKGVTYPDGQQLEDGTIYIIYDYGRSTHQMILMTSFTEADIVPGSDTRMIRVHQRRKVVGQGGIQ